MLRYVEIGKKGMAEILRDTKMDIGIVKCIRYKEYYYHSNPYC